MNKPNPKPDPYIIEIVIADKAYAVDIDEPLTIKELCFFMRRAPTYLSAMRRAGFTMEFDPIDRCPKATIRQYKKWLMDHLDFSFHRAYNKPAVSKKKNDQVMPRREQP